MAQETLTRLVDDLDGSEAVESIRFGYKGREYEIDLNEKHAQALEESLLDWIPSARQVKASGKTASRAVRRPAAVGRDQLRAIRDWARNNDYNVKDRGRVPQQVLDAYNAAH